MSMRFEWLVNKAPFTGFLSPKGIEKMSTIRPKNWDDFQHYKNRRPIWIKLHRTLLDDFDFHGLPLASRALAPMLWLLAGDYEQANIPLDYAMLGFRFRMSSKEAEQAIKPLIDKGFFNLYGDASDLLAECLPREEKRREETEGEKKPAKPSAGLSASDLVAMGVDEQVAIDFLSIRRAKKSPLTTTALQGIEKEAEKAGVTLSTALATCAIRGWQSFKAEWHTQSNGQPQQQQQQTGYKEYRPK